MMTYGRGRVLILSQQHMNTGCRLLVRQVYIFFGIDAAVPDNVGVRVHQSGDVRFKTLSRLTKSDIIARRVLRAFVPRKLWPTIVFWTEMFNTRPQKCEGVPEDLRRAHGYFVRRPAAFLRREFGPTPPWHAVSGQKPEDG